MRVVKSNVVPCGPDCGKPQTIPSSVTFAAPASVDARSTTSQSRVYRVLANKPSAAAPAATTTNASHDGRRRTIDAISTLATTMRKRERRRATPAATASVRIQTTAATPPILHAARRALFLRVQHHLVLAALLGAVHGLVGLGEELLAAACGVRIHRHAHTHREIAHFSERILEATVLAHHAAQTFCRVQGLELGCPRQENHDLLTAVPERHVDFTQVAANDVRNRDQSFIALLVTELVVDLLEIVYVDYQHGQRRARAHGALDFNRQLPVEELAVVYTGE